MLVIRPVQNRVTTSGRGKRTLHHTDQSKKHKTGKELLIFFFRQKAVVFQVNLGHYTLNKLLVLISITQVSIACTACQQKLKVPLNGSNYLRGNAPTGTGQTKTAEIS